MDEADTRARTDDGSLDASDRASRLARLADIIERRATDTTGCCGPIEMGVAFHRLVRCQSMLKSHALGPSLTVVARGAKRVTFDRLELVYDSGRYIVFTGESTYDAEILDATPNRPYLAATVILPVELIVKTLLALGDDTDAPASTELPPAFVGPFDTALLDVVTRLLVAMDDPSERRIVAPLVREELVFRVLRSNAGAVVRSAVRARDAGEIHDAMRFIQERAPHRRLTVEQIAKHVAMSPSHFAHRFRSVAGVSPMRYLKQVRLDAARSLLLGSRLRVAELATRVGYESTSHFSRDFKLAFGVSPAELARRIAAGSGTSTAVAGMAEPLAHP